MTLLDAGPVPGTEDAALTERQKTASHILMPAVAKRLRSLDEAREVDTLLPLSSEEVAWLEDAIERYTGPMAPRMRSRLAMILRDAGDSKQREDIKAGAKFWEAVRCAIVEELRSRGWTITRSRRVCAECAAEIDDRSCKARAYWDGPEGRARLAAMRSDNRAAQERFLREEAARGN